MHPAVTNPAGRHSLFNEVVRRLCVGKPSKRGYLKRTGESLREMCPLTPGADPNHSSFSDSLLPFGNVRREGSR
jgi:hypothetical protein